MRFTQNKREEHLQNLARTDAMTVLRNRGSGAKIISEKFFAKNGGMFYFLDADKFKSINDNFGHEFGDKVIKILRNV